MISKKRRHIEDSEEAEGETLGTDKPALKFPKQQSLAYLCFSRPGLGTRQKPNTIGQLRVVRSRHSATIRIQSLQHLKTEEGCFTEAARFDSVICGP